MTTAIIDADVLIYEAAVAAEEAYEWEPDLWSYRGDMAKARRLFADSVESICAAVNASDFRLPLTDPSRNWRLDILPTYKGNRKEVRRPLLRRPLFDWVLGEYGPAVAYMRPTLEGDDVAGLMLTNNAIVAGPKVLVSIDKDMKTLPGRHYNPRTGKWLTVTQEQANYALMYQTLTGDTTDGYRGCPGCGPKAATKLLDEAAPGGLPAMWAAVVKRYKAAGLTAEDALVQARVARILRHGDYDYKQRKPILWTPPELPRKRKKKKK